MAIIEYNPCQVLFFGLAEIYESENVMAMMVKDKFCKTLRKSILLGKLNPGERLIESDLSEKYGVSRGMIRESLMLLSNEGFITISPNKGASVAKISTQELEDYYGLIAVLERKAIEWATPNMTAADIEKLLAINESLRDAMISESQKRLQGWGELNLSFHRFIWDKCGNAKLSWLVEIIRQRIFRYRYTLFMITSSDDYIKDHARIIDCIKKHDPEEAGQAMEDHVYRALSVLMKFFS